MRSKVRRFLLLTSFVLFAVVALIGTAVWIIDPGPAGRLVIASGGAGGAYDDLASSYARTLARYGVALELRSDIEGADALQSVLGGGSAAQSDGAFLKGGLAGSLRGRLASPADQLMHEMQVQALQSLGRMFFEPLWVFYRGPKLVSSLGEFKGKRIMVGTASSGTRRVVTLLLKANGVTPENSTFIEKDFPADAKPLAGDGADVAFVSLPPESKKVQALLRVPNIFLMDFSAEAEAYTSRFPFLTKVVLHRGSVEFEPDIPSADITLLATMPALVIRKDLHPALATLLVHAAAQNPKPSFDRQGEPILFFKAGQFPTANDPEYDLAPDARIYYRAGELPLILRSVGPMNANLGIPFWVTAFAHQHATKIVLLLIPLLSILIPLMRLLPMIYSWSMRRRFLRWYDKLKAIEHALDHTPAPAAIADVHAELERIDQAVSRIRVPRAFSDQLYDLRGHVDLVRQRLTPRMLPVQAAAE